MVALVPEESPLSAHTEISAREIVEAGFIGLEVSSRLGQVLRTAFERDQATYDPRIEVRYCSTAAMLAQSGLGVAVVDPFTATLHAASELVKLPFNPPCAITAILILRKGVPRSRLVHSFIEELRKQFQTVNC
jgi:DNA-binding transcriptional LysR family regulator